MKISHSKKIEKENKIERGFHIEESMFTFDSGCDNGFYLACSGCTGGE
jgi:hypothetical protein